MSEDHELGLFNATFNSMESADSRSAKEVNNRFTTPNTAQSSDTEQQQQQQQQLQLSCTFADSVAVALICGKHQTVALCRLQPEKGGHWFPMVQLKAQQSQLATVEQLIRRLLKARPTANSGTGQAVPPPPQLIDTLRIQVPVSLFFVKRFLFHCQFPVGITDCECMHSTPTTPSSSPTSSSAQVVWWPLTEAIKLTSLWGPEPTVHLSGPFQSAHHPLPHILQEVTVEETLGQIAEAAEKRRMLQAIGLTEQDLLILYGDFIQHCFPSAVMSLTSFQSYLLKRGLNVGGGNGGGQDNSNNSHNTNSTSQQLFNAFRSQSSAPSAQSSSYIRLPDLLFGLAALDAKTSHGDETGKLRAKYMYRYYKRNADSEDGLDYDSMRWFVRDLQMEKRMLSSQSEGAAAEQQLEAAVKGTYAEMEVPYRQLVTERAFLKAIAYKKVRGTSLIFRIRPSPLGTIISKVKAAPVVVEGGQQQQQSSVTVSSGMAGLGSSSARQLTLSTHFVSLAFDGTVYAPMRMQSADGQQPASSITGSKAARARFEELFYSKFVANELIEAIRKFSADTVNSTWGSALRTKKMAGWAEKLEQLCQQVAPILQAEERIVRLNSPILCFGDIHGNLNDLMHFEQTLWRRGPLLSGLNYLFLGDYVDRGNYSVEVVAYLFSCKLLSPEQFVLIRGNHETRLVNSAFTFLKECQEKFGIKKGLAVSGLQVMLLNLFSLLSFSSDVGDLQSGLWSAAHCRHHWRANLLRPRWNSGDGEQSAAGDQSDSLSDARTGGAVSVCLGDALEWSAQQVQLHPT